jgi:hypothetical protein
MQDLAEQIGAFVTMALSPPTMGMGGGSVAEERAQDAWRARVRAEWARLRALAVDSSPVTVHILDAARPAQLTPEEGRAAWNALYGAAGTRDAVTGAPRS